MVKIFIITLKHSNRVLKVIKYFQKYDLPLSLFYGIDGRVEDLSKYNIDTKTHQRFWHNSISCCSYNHKLTNSEFGCALSHIKLYEHIVQNNIPLCIICEDDMIPYDNNFKEVINSLDEIQSQLNFEILFFKYIDKLNSPFRKQVSLHSVTFAQVGMGEKYDWLFNRRKTCYLTGCYALTLNGAKKLLEKAYPVRMPSDRLTGLIAYNKLKAWKTIPHLVTETGAPSTIVHYTGN